MFEVQQKVQQKMFAWVRSKAKAVSEGTTFFLHTQIYYNIFHKSLHVVNTALAINYINLC